MLFISRLFRWFTILLSGRPHFIVGRPGSPYMLRWWLVPRNPFFNVYLHKFLRSDDDRAKHDHPWFFVSILISGRYVEYLERDGVLCTNHRSSPSIAFRRTTDRHIVELHTVDGKAETCWTILITGPKVREWGFWCPKGFVPWTQFVDHTDTGNVGRGCE